METINYERIREKCKIAKIKRKLTNEQIASATQISIGTVNRFFGNGRAEFRISTINDIASYLLEEYDIPNAETFDEPQGKEDIVSVLQATIKQRRLENAELREQIEKQAENFNIEITKISTDYQRRIDYMKESNFAIDKDKRLWRGVSIFLILFMCAAIVLDLLQKDSGWLQFGMMLLM